MPSASFRNVETQWNPEQSGIDVRFQLSDGKTGDPLPYLAATAFTARVGPTDRPRLICPPGSPRCEGIAHFNHPERTFGSTKYVTLLLDTSMSIEPTDLKSLVHDFITDLTVERGNTYVRLRAFSGSRQLLELTKACSQFAGAPSFCSANIASNREVLAQAVETLDASLAAWEHYDAHSSNVYGSVTRCTEEHEIAAQMHADYALDDSAIPSATSNYLVIFTDLDDSAHVETFGHMTDALKLGDRSSTVSFVVMDHDARFVEANPGLVAAIAGEVDLLSLRHEVHHESDVQRLHAAFAEEAARFDREANSWYELYICPPDKSGVGIPLTIQTEGFDGSLTTHFDATGWDLLLPPACPYDQQMIQVDGGERFCESRRCGFEAGVFCGICDIAEHASARDENGPYGRDHDENGPNGPGWSTVALDETRTQVIQFRWPADAGWDEVTLTPLDSDGTPILSDRWVDSTSPCIKVIAYITGGDDNTARMVPVVPRGAAGVELECASALPPIGMHTAACILRFAPAAATGAAALALAPLAVMLQLDATSPLVHAVSASFTSANRVSGVNTPAVSVQELITPNALTAILSPKASIAKRASAFYAMLLLVTVCASI
jgi:hypothetical protein